MVEPGGDEREDDDGRQRDGDDTHAHAAPARDFAPHVDGGVRRDDPRHHLEDRQVVEEFVLLDPAQAREDVIRDGEDRVAAADDEKRNPEELEKEAQEFFHGASSSEGRESPSRSNNGAMNVRETVRPMTFRAIPWKSLPALLRRPWRSARRVKATSISGVFAP